MKKKESLCHDEQLDALRKHAKRVHEDRAIVNIGVYRGASVLALAEGAREGCGATVYGVDPWDLQSVGAGGRWHFEASEHYEAARAKTQHLDNVRLIKGYSADVAKEFNLAVSLLFIDGDHSFDSVADDFQVWEPMLVPGATVIFDDLDTQRNPGVRHALEWLCLDWEVEADRLAVVRYLPQ